LFAEYCLLLEEDWPDFVARHTPHRLRQLHRQLGAVGLWPPELAPVSNGAGLIEGAKRAITGLLGGMRPNETREPIDIQGESVALTVPDSANEALIGRVPEMVLQSLITLPLTIDLSATLARDPAFNEGNGPLQDLIARARYLIAQDLGFAFPLVHLNENPVLGPEGYAIRIYGETVGEGRLPPGCVAALGPGLPTDWKLEPHPSRPEPLAWIAQGAANAWEGKVETLAELLAAHLEDVIRRHAARLFTNQELDQLLRVHEMAIGKETIPELLGRFMSLSELRLVLQTMLRQGQSIRNLPRIIEILMNHFINYLADKQLSMDETWKLSSHIPFFSTDELVSVVCRGLGMPARSERLASVQASLERAMRQDASQPPVTRPLVPPLRDSEGGRNDRSDREPTLPVDTEEGAL
jgi:hypothetical protein